MDKEKKEKKDKGYEKFSIFSMRKKQVDRMMGDLESGRKTSATKKK